MTMNQQEQECPIAELLQRFDEFASNITAFI